ncbi:MAG: DUF4335 domain-containing protein [Cyanobacteriota bacterium]|nr:DUF4335 domain-containing protein [Cyanobacteriota bacterium]
MVTQTYTPPTCTLTVTTKGSPILGKSRRQEFELNLDDPRLPEERHFSIKGDRSDLEDLYQVVNSYVRDFLKYSPTDKPDFSEPKAEQLPDTTSQVSQTNDSLEQDGGRLPPSNPYAIPANSGIALKPRDLLTHELFLGTLATETTGPMIPLSVLHLFDLLVALEQFQKDSIAVPYLAAGQEPEPTPEWLKSLILILITAGLTVLGMRLYDRYILARQAEENNLAGVNGTNNPEKVLSPSPSPVIPRLPPLPSPTVSPSPLALPTPPTSGLPNVKPSPIDVPVLFPSPVPTPSSPNFSFPPPSGGNATRGNGTNVVILPQIPPPVPPQRPVFPPAALPDTSVPLEPRPPAIPPPNISPPPIPPGGYPRNRPQMSRNGVKPFIDVSRFPLSVPGDIDLPALDDTNVALIPKNRRDGGEVAEGEPEDSDRTLFDSIPQVAEVRKHFEQSWEAPEELDKSLQYSLMLNSDGSIRKVIPIGQASVDFYELTNMPVEEEPFVSDIGEGKTATVRLVLRNNGKVQTFLESDLN